MSELLIQVREIEQELMALLEADELDAEAMAGILARRQSLHEALVDAVDGNPDLAADAKPLLQQALENNTTVQSRSEAERADTKAKLIKLSTAKKARKAY
jgi:predicted unusual protein kinase regulating ubiquinone biosynthesis (AarF/ABC1/UbiB family)